MKDDSKPISYEVIFDNNLDFNDASYGAMFALNAIQVMTAAIIQDYFCDEYNQHLINGIEYLAKKGGEEMDKICGMYRFGKLKEEK